MILGENNNEEIEGEIEGDIQPGENIYPVIPRLLSKY